MNLALPRIVAAALVAVLVAPAAHAQYGGSLYGSAPYYADQRLPAANNFARPNNQPAANIGINPAARQALSMSNATTTTPAAAVPTPPALTQGAQNALNYFGGQSARQTLAQMPQPRRFIPQGGAQVGAGARVKPYTGATSAPTISPYLNLFRDETEDSAPNYYAFVRPQQQQLQANQAQRRQIQSLERQVQRTAMQPSTSGAGAIPPTGVRARFGDTGQYFGGFQR